MHYNTGNNVILPYEICTVRSNIRSKFRLHPKAYFNIKILLFRIALSYQYFFIEKSI